MNQNECCMCKKPRGIAQLRKSWSLEVPIVSVPSPAGKGMLLRPEQLLINAAVWRNGGSGDSTHICDECLCVGLRAIKTKIHGLLGDMGGDNDKDAQIVQLTARLATLQNAHANLINDHDRMQDRLAHVLRVMDAAKVKGDDEVKRARWEVKRGHCEKEIES